MNNLSTTFYELFCDNLSVRPAKEALIDTDRSLTYKQLEAEITTLSAYLQDQGICPGDRVIVNLRKGIPEVVAMFAISMVGAVIVNVNAQLSFEQFCYIVENCGAKLALVEPRTAEALATSTLTLPTLLRIVVYGKTPDEKLFQSWPSNNPSINAHIVNRLDSELAMIIYTSGSTGKPKGVMLSHRNILAGARSVARYLKLRENDRILSVLPYSFDYGLNQLTTMMLVGGTIVHQAVPLAAEIVKSLNKYAITGLAAVPPLWNQIVRLLKENNISLASLRYITNSGGKISPTVLELMPDVFPDIDIYLMYGLTEAFRSTYLSPEKFHTKKGSIGKAIPGAEIYVVKHGEGVITRPGESGELVHRGPLISMGYWGLPEKTSQTIRPCSELAHIIGDEPVVYSGDTVKLDKDGDIWFIGRNDGLIKTSGFRLSPEEVEDVIYRSSMVGDVVAFGVPHEELGEAVHIAVTLLSNFAKQDLIKYCNRSMAHYMIPKSIYVWSGDMPKTASGKLARKEISAFAIKFEAI
jgi:acyl-CoA ligase (AMP-forming) (exosortase A-associated)